jgi:hypothetical protein
MLTMKIVTIGSSALRSTCVRRMRCSETPFARAKRT